MKKIFALIIFTALFLSACSRGDPSILSQITPPAAPDSDKATVVGRVFDIKTGAPLADVIIRLADVVENKDTEKEGFFVMNVSFSPGTRTDAQGYFVFENIPAGKYVIAVGEGENFNNYDVIEETGGGKAKIWEAPAGEISDWGELKAEVLFR